MAYKIVPGGTPARAIAGKSPQELPAQRQEYRDDVQAVKAALFRQRAAGNDLGQLGHPVLVEARWESATGRPPKVAGGLRAAVQCAQPVGRGRSRVLMAHSSWKAVPAGA
ncbi:hypothetical protein [Arthrobacter sp. ZGTC131]|uniref:hypothetical protein n=1 Tax=Arthrobacter sp. ZGTC131 TaxID=2058898 RepID=UPI000CE4FCF6|nr:hypothetical protein [Arthrobacter sp. ZGTC131]